MKSGADLNASLRVINPDLIEFLPDTGSRRTLKGSFFIFTGIVVFVDLLMAIFWENFWRTLINGDDKIGYWVIQAIPFIFLALWLCAPKVKIFIERKTQSIILRSGKNEHVFPWGQVDFTFSWTPLTSGKAGWIFLHVIPPFPGSLVSEFGKKRRKSSEAETIFRLGSIFATSPDHGRAIFEFLKDWMRGQGDPRSLYESMVSKPFGD